MPAFLLLQVHLIVNSPPEVREVEILILAGFVDYDDDHVSIFVLSPSFSSNEGDRWLNPL